MDNKEPLRNVFYPLGERLNFFESGHYLLSKKDFAVSVNQDEYSYYDLIDQIEREVNKFDSIAVYELASEYLLRTYKIIELLEKGRKKYTQKEKVKFENWKEELEEYLSSLAGIIMAREDIYQLSKPEKDNYPSNKVIQLPDKFTIRDIQLHFKPKPHEEIALLMYYLSKAGIMPPYEQSQYGKIAPIFGIHEKTIAKDIRYIGTPSKPKLGKLKKLVEALLETINDDYTKAPNR